MSSTTHRNLASLEPNQAIDGIYSLVNPQVGTTRQGKPFFKALLRDSSGEAPVRMWTFEESRLGEVAATGFVWVSGRTELYNGAIQIMLDGLRAAEVTEEDLVHLLPTTTSNIEAMFARVSAIMRSLHHPAMQALAEAYLGDEAIMSSFRRAPAAVSIHHAFIGGLLEHTLQLLELAERMLPLYPGMNRDLVLMGLFLHDLGKTSELEWERGFSYTAEGQLIGHLVRGAIWLQIKAATAARASGAKLPSEALLVLQHIIISHHGKLEHGAAKLPATPEAVFVARLDELDAKTTAALAAAARGKPLVAGQPFTDRNFALETRIYRPDPLAAESAATNA